MIILLSRLNAIKDQTAEEMGSKRKLNDLGLTPSSKRRHTNFGGPMENLSMKYPHLSESIFNKIDNLTLNICRRMSTIWCGFIDEQRSTWIRTLQKHVKNFEESPETWKKAESISKRRSVLKRGEGMLVFVICGFIKNFLPNSYFILQIYHVKSFKVMHVTSLYFNFSVKYS